MKSKTIRFRNMNTDITDKMLPDGSYKLMRNCRPNNLNTGSGGAVENIKSTSALIPPVDAGQTFVYKGGCIDSKRNAIIEFYKGTTYNTITSYDTKAGTMSYVLKTSLVSFDDLVTSAAVLDDYLFWIDADNKMRKINVVAAMANPTLNYFAQSGDLLVDKFPPLKVPTVSAEQDSSFESNNITNSIFQFCYAWEYEGKELSSWSPLSVSVMPQSADDYTFVNNCIDVTVATGGATVKKIYIAYRIGETGEFKLTERLDKAKQSIGNNTNYTYRFYNNKFIEQLVKEDVLTTTNNPFFEFGSMSISRDNFIIAGWVKDGLEKPTDLSLALTYNVSSTNTRRCTHKTGAVHEFGIVFRDENGRTDGVNARAEIEIPFLTSTENGMRAAVISASALSGFFPYVTISYSLTGTIPTWAKSMSFVYLGNKTLSTFIQYTLSDISDAGDFTYLDLTQLNSINSTISVLEPISQSTNISAYTFTKGDRIRFIREDRGSLLSGIYDYEILGYVPEVTDSSGNILYKDTIYVPQFDWVSASIGKNSLFEIYSPKKEYADNVFFEIGETILMGGETGEGGDPINISGSLQCGDAYVFERTMNLFDLAEFGSDKDYRFDVRGEPFQVPPLSIVKSVDGSKVPTNDISASGALAFYVNKSGESKTVEVTGNYDFTAETDDGMTFSLTSFLSGAVNTSYLIASNPNTSGGKSFYHSGEISQTVVLPNNAELCFIFSIPPTGAFITRSAMTLNFSAKIYSTADGDSVTEFVESKNYSDYYDSDEHSFGRPYVEIEENLIKKNILVSSGKYFADTQINDTHKFNDTNVRYIPYEHGYVTALKVIGDVLKVLTPNKEVSFYLGKEAYSNGSGVNNFVLTDSAIGSMNVYDSDNGTESPESLLATSNSLYYYDRKNASIIRTSNNGQLDIAVYGLKTRLRSLTNVFNNGTTKNVFIGSNDKNEEVVVCFVVDGQQYTYVFNERDNIWTHQVDLQDASGNPPQGMINYGETFVVYVDGAPYQMESPSASGYGEFFGDQKTASILCVMNQEPFSTKILQSLSYQGLGAWEIDVNTPTTDTYLAGQYTKITTGRQKRFEGVYRSDVSRNLLDKNGVSSNVRYAIGQPMRGQVATLSLTNNNNTRVLLDELTVNYIDSSLTF